MAHRGSHGVPDRAAVIARAASVAGRFPMTAVRLILRGDAMAAARALLIARLAIGLYLVELLLNLTRPRILPNEPALTIFWQLPGDADAPSRQETGVAYGTYRPVTNGVLVADRKPRAPETVHRHSSIVGTPSRRHGRKRFPTPGGGLAFAMTQESLRSPLQGLRREIGRPVHLSHFLPTASRRTPAGRECDGRHYGAELPIQAGRGCRIPGRVRP
jgi:hypothetical protein